MARYVLLIGFFILVGVFALVLDRMGKGEYNPRTIPTEFIGKPAPQIHVPRLFDADKMVNTDQFRGQPWLFNIWGTWCPECWREHAFLNELKKAGVPIIGLNWRDERSEAIAMLNQLGNPFVEIGFDPDSSVAMDWGVYGAPETFLIDAQGVVIAKHAGGLTPDIWQKKFAAYFERTAGSEQAQ